MAEEERIGPYVLEERVARGGMGEVWRARAPDGSHVCIKRLDHSLRDDVDFIEMFRDEAATVLDLDHPNVVKMFELIDDDKELAQIMEYIDGPSLARIRGALGDEGGAGLTVGEALQIGVYLLRALHHAHTRTRDGVVGGAPLAIVHRDVSPQNILVDRKGRLKLVDFGIAKAAQRLTRTRAGTLKGKLSYMAPEQARGEPLDHRADQFAAGILVWEMLTGRRLFGGRNELLILEQVQKSDPVPPSTVKKGVPRSVDRAVLRALRWHPEERYPDTAAFERALQGCLQELAPSGVVDLVPLVERTLAHAPEKTAERMALQGAVRTRVLAGDAGTTASDSGSGGGGTSSDDSSSEPSFDDATVAISSTDPSLDPLLTTDPSHHPERTGDFFAKRSRLSPALLVTGAVAVVAAGAVGVAVWIAEREPVDKPVSASKPAPFTDLDGARAALSSTVYANGLKECSDPCAPRQLEAAKFPARLDTPGALQLDRCLAACGVDGAGAFQPLSVEKLEAKLNAAAAHPCRTELLDDLLDKAPLSDLGRAAIADDVETCVKHAADARRLRETAKLDAPAWPKKKKRTRIVVGARVAELEKRGRIALAAGEYTRAKELLIEALSLDASHIDNHALVGQAFRGLGDPTGAAYHFRLWLHAKPDDADAERVMRYLARYKQQYQLKASADPTAEERHVRASRLVDDAAEHPERALALLESAHALLPDDARISLKLGDAYAAAGRPFDARRAFEEAVEKGGSTTAKQARERLAKLGS